MLVHRGQRTEFQALTDFFERRRVTILLHKLGDEVVNLSLPPGDCHAAILGEGKANVKNNCEGSELLF